MSVRLHSAGHAQSGETPDAVVKSVVDAIRILDFLAKLDKPAGVRQVATALDISKSGCQRVLATLGTQGVVERDGQTGRYAVGWRLHALTAAHSRSNILTQISRPVMMRLTETTGETSCLHVPVPGGRIPVLQFESPQELLWSAQVGKVYPLYRGAAGKVLLAHLPHTEVKHQLERCAADNGRPFADGVRRELQPIREAGYAVNRGEDFPDVYGVAVPVYDEHGEVLASLSVYGPGSRLGEAALTHLEGVVTRAAREISSRLGKGEAYPHSQAKPVGTGRLVSVDPHVAD